MLLYIVVILLVLVVKIFLGMMSYIIQFILYFIETSENQTKHQPRYIPETLCEDEDDTLEWKSINV